MDELLILVDANDQQVGVANKLQAHQEGLLHRAFSLFVFDSRGWLLLQRRAPEKYHSGGLWTNTCCGHPRDGEPTEDAAHRRLGEEMGFDCALQEVTAFIYEAQVPGGLIEHEFDHVFIGRHDGEPVPNPAEASDWMWIAPCQLLSWMDAEPDLFTVWFKTILVSSGNKLKQWSQQIRGAESDVPMQELVAYQKELLFRVSRNFALTIPQLPPELSQVVTHAYLLLRLADTIEDEPALTPVQITHFEQALVEVVTGRLNAQCFSDEVAALLTEQTVEAEHELLAHLPLLMQVHNQLTAAQREVIVNCLRVITRGMSEFRQALGLRGMQTRQDLDRYCYCVSGVVGEMMTELFIDYDPTLVAYRDTLRRLSVSFGAGLQLTNILKDQWEDRQRGICWLPHDLFAEHSIHLLGLQPDQTDVNYERALSALIGTAHAHLQLALQYALLIPSRQAGIRRFVLWTGGLALLTLERLSRVKGFSSGHQVDLARSQVALMMRLTRASQRSNTGLRLLFKLAARRLPLTPLDAQWQEAAYAIHQWPRSSIDFLADPPSNSGV